MRTAVLGMVALLLPVSVQSQQLVQIDLTKDKVDTVKVGVGNFTVRLSNALPGRKYEIRAEVVGTKEPALVDLKKVRVDTIRITQRDTVFGPNVQPPPPPVCAIRDTMSVYLPIRSELDIAGTMEAVRRAMALDTAKNRECTLEVRRGAQFVVTRGTYQGAAAGGGRVSAGQTVAATVYRDEMAVGAIILESTASSRGGFLSYGVHYPMGSRVRRYAVGSADADGKRQVKAAGTDGADPAVLLAVSIPTPTSWLYASGFLPTGFSDGAVIGWAEEVLSRSPTSS